MWIKKKPSLHLLSLSRSNNPMELPLLKLIITKGPREGETVEFRAGSTVRIGRVVRGNNLTIKDAGISSKHLVIGSDSGKWTVQDLESSNGTALNSTPLPPFQSFDLRDGDTLKLGELTTVLVQFVCEPASQLRRNPRRRANQSSKERVNDGSQDEEAAPPPPPVPESRGRGRRRKAKAGGLASEDLATVEVNRTERVNTGSLVEEAAPAPAAVPVSRRRGRPPRARVCESNSEKAETEEVNSIVTRSRRKVDDVIPEEQVKKTRGGRRRKENLPELPPENAQLDCVVERESVDLGLRNAGETHENPIDVDGTGGGLDSGEKFRGGAEEVGAKESGQELGPSEREEDMVAGEGGVKENGHELGRGVREEHMVAEESGVKEIEEVTRGDSEEEDMVVEEGGVKDSEEARPCDSEEEGGKGNVEVDLEKMTLGEWFDYMEENLPKQIIEVTDKMIEGMKKKAELVKQYMEEQKKMKEP
ncbi:hypothetical protein Tsubulata_034545, partial [Turnera subulata]